MLYTRSFGNHHPICGGQCLVAHTGCLNMCPLSTALILGPSGLWFYLFYSSAHLLITVIITFTLVGSIGCLCTAYLTEPGILPTVDEDLDGNTRPKKLIVLPGEDKRTNMIEHRAKYCRDTSNTIEKFDHFCPWTGNGVGIRNYRYYFCFLVFTTLLALEVMVTSALGAIVAGSSSGSGGSSSGSGRGSGSGSSPGGSSPGGNAVEDNNGTIAMLGWLLVVYCVLILMLVGGLLSYHIPLVSKNMTTNEDVKHVYSYNKRNPYDLGCKQNWWVFLRSTITCPRKSYVTTTPDAHRYDRCCNNGDDNEEDYDRFQDRV
jgi:hypothetical protein